MKSLLKGRSLDLTIKKQFVVFAILLVVAFLFYGGTLQNGYSIDDRFVYTANKIANNGLNDVKAIFNSASFDYGNYKFGYRPIAILSFAIENELFGISPAASHFFNLLIYLISCFILFKFIAALFPEENLVLSFLTTLFFLFLPIHTEIVNNIKCRDELLMLLFGLTASYYWVKGTVNKKYFPLALLFLVLSVLSKKSGFIFLGILPVITFFKTKGNWKKSLVSFLIMVAPVLIFKLITKFVKVDKSIRSYHFVENPLFTAKEGFSKLTIVLESTWFYLKNLLLPTQFVSYYGYKTIPITGISEEGILAILLCVGFALLALKAIKSQDAYLFGVIVFLGGLISVVNLIVPMVGIVAERFITIGSIGFCIFIVFGVNSLLSKFDLEKLKPYAVGLLLIYGIAYLPVIKKRNKQWKSDISVMEADVKKVPQSVIMTTNLASNYNTRIGKATSQQLKSNMGRRVIELCNQSISVYPTIGAYFNMGSIQYLVFKDAKNAEKNMKLALQLDSSHIGALNNLSYLYKDEGNTALSVKYFKSLLKQHPKQADAYMHLAQQLVENGYYDDALTWVDKGIRENGETYALVLSKGNTLFMMKRYQESLPWFEKVLKMKPDNQPVRQRVNLLRAQRR